MTDALSDFRAFLDELGLVPRHVVADGKWHRCPTKAHPKKKNGSWKLQPHMGIGWGLDFAMMGSPVAWRPGKDVATAAFDPDKLAAAREAARQAKREAHEQMLRAIRKARAFWEQCRPLTGGHDYLRAHGLDMRGCAGLRVDADGWIVVPMMREGALVSLQRISPDGTKLFWKHAPSGSTHYDIDRPGAPLNVVCEGLATGLAVYAAVPTARVRIAFSAHNILAGVKTMPNGLTVIASDNDHRTVCPKHKEAGLEAPYEPWEERPEWCRCNPGRCYAAAAAAEVGCGVAVPVCNGTDWADYRQERMADRLAKLLPHERESGARRAVDAEIARAITRHARFVSRVLR